MGSASIAEQMDQIDALAGKASAVNFVVAQAWEAVTLGPSFVALSKAWSHKFTTGQHQQVYMEKKTILVWSMQMAMGKVQQQQRFWLMQWIIRVKLDLFTLSGTMDQCHASKRRKGYFAKYPEIKIIAEAGFTDPSESYDLALGMLQANQDIDAVWGTWMIGPATGAAEAVIALKKAGEIVVAAPDLGGITGARYIADP